MKHFRIFFIGATIGVAKLLLTGNFFSGCSKEDEKTLVFSADMLDFQSEAGILRLRTWRGDTNTL